MNKKTADRPQGEPPASPYALKFPEPVDLWKWAARNSRRTDQPQEPLSLAGFFKRSVRATAMLRGEPHETFVRRALIAATRELLLERKQAGLPVPLWVEEKLAAELAQS